MTTSSWCQRNRELFWCSPLILWQKAKNAKEKQRTVSMLSPAPVAESKERKGEITLQRIENNYLLLAELIVLYSSLFLFNWATYWFSCGNENRWMLLNYILNSTFWGWRCFYWESLIAASPTTTWAAALMRSGYAQRWTGAKPSLQ